MNYWLRAIDSNGDKHLINVSNICNIRDAGTTCALSMKDGRTIILEVSLSDIEDVLDDFDSWQLDRDCRVHKAKKAVNG